MTLLDRAMIKAFAETAPRAAERESRPVIATVLHATPTSGTAQAAVLPRAAVPAGKQPAATATQAATPQLPGSLSPLSTFTADPEIRESARAQLEVDHLAWPPACDDLLARAAQSLNRFAEQLVERIGQGQKTIALASCRRGEGRTTVSLVIAKHLAARGLRPVVVDADSQNPNLARNCGISEHAGWGDVLEGQRPLGDALIASIHDGVTLMPWRGSAIGSAQLASSMRSATSFSMLRDHYDLVLLDTMPLRGQTTVSDFADFARWIHLDALYLVHDVRSSAREELADTWAQLRRAGVHVEGIIENFVSPADTNRVAGPEESKPVADQAFAA